MESKVAGLVCLYYTMLLGQRFAKCSAGPCTVHQTQCNMHCEKLGPCKVSLCSEFASQKVQVGQLALTYWEK